VAELSSRIALGYICALAVHHCLYVAASDEGVRMKSKPLRALAKLARIGEAWTLRVAGVAGSILLARQK